MMHPRRFPVHAITREQAILFRRLSLKLYTKVEFPCRRLVSEPQPVSDAPRPQCSALRNPAFDSTKPRACARLSGHPGAGGGFLDLGNIFPGRAAGIIRRPFCLAKAQGPPKARDSPRQRYRRVRHPRNSVHGRRTTEIGQSLGAGSSHQLRTEKTCKEKKRQQADRRRGYHGHMVPLESISGRTGSRFLHPDGEAVIVNGVGNWSEHAGFPVPTVFAIEACLS
jgi:hypothetical protein